jgi:Xaa-Pro aminopeptidase
VAEIPAIQYLERQQELAHTLTANNASALIAESGATMKYYTNVDWALSERPFVMVLKPDISSKTGVSLTFVVPAFEALRAHENIENAALPKSLDIKVVEWEESSSPYEKIESVLSTDGDIQLDISIRLFLADGISKLAPNRTIMASPEVQILRMIKSHEEVEIMRCANQATVAAIKEVKKHVGSGISENQIASMTHRALQTAGLSETWVLALIDERAALPHGEAGDHRLGDEGVVLIDAGGRLKGKPSCQSDFFNCSVSVISTCLVGYESDITRTFFVSENPKKFNETIYQAWHTVKEAQSAVIKKATLDLPCAEVDTIARQIINNANYGDFFKHRLGHGIGLEGHEQPYMVQSNTAQSLKPGMTFSVEPGIYVPHEFGIRLEDIVVMTKNGIELLSGGLANSPWEL